MKRLFLCLLALLALQPIAAALAAPAPEPEPPPQSAAPEEQIDYLSIMLQAAVAGDLEAGRSAERLRDEQLTALGSGEARISFDELLLLAKLIQSEAGSSRIGIEWRMCVGEVVLNRAASPEFPDSIEGVIFQPGQYAEAGTEEFLYALDPDETSVQAALRLLQGERLMEPQVVFQANFRQGGEVYALFYDRIYGYTYFCTSPHPELYA